MKTFATTEGDKLFANCDWKGNESSFEIISPLYAIHNRRADILGSNAPAGEKARPWTLHHAVRPVRYGWVAGADEGASATRI
jgi:hypothetical protein